MRQKKEKMGKSRKKIPSKFSLMICPKHNYNKSYIYLNFSIIRMCCGPTENRTRDFCVSDKHFTTKLLAHNFNHKDNKYLNFAGKVVQFNKAWKK